MPMQDLPISRLLPNALTLLSLSAGLTGIQMALQGHWENAGLAIVFAAVFDVLDGRVARLLNSASKFGAELDSLSDCVSFGVAPGMVLYLWSLQGAGSLGWVAVLILAVCCALRLARFNTMLEATEVPAWAKGFFTGVPAPAGAGLALFPFFLHLAWADMPELPPVLVSLWVMLCGGLMISRLPTLALKGRRIAPVWVAPLMVAVGLLLALMITNPWTTLSLLAVLYVVSLPVGFVLYNRHLKQEKKHD